MASKQIFINWDDEDCPQPYPSDLINLLREEELEEQKNKRT